MDPLSEVLSLLSNQTVFFGGLRAGGGTGLFDFLRLITSSSTR